MLAHGLLAARSKTRLVAFRRVGGQCHTCRGLSRRRTCVEWGIRQREAPREPSQSLRLRRPAQGLPRRPPRHRQQQGNGLVCNFEPRVWPSQAARDRHVAIRGVKGIESAHRLPAGRRLAGRLSSRYDQLHAPAPRPLMLEDGPGQRLALVRQAPPTPDVGDWAGLPRVPPVGGQGASEIKRVVAGLLQDGTAVGMAGPHIETNLDLLATQARAPTTLDLGPPLREIRLNAGKPIGEPLPTSVGRSASGIIQAGASRGAAGCVGKLPPSPIISGRHAGRPCPCRIPSTRRRAAYRATPCSPPSRRP